MTEACPVSRGVFGNDFVPKDILRFCKNFSTLIESGECVIGRDTRPTGEIIMYYVSASLMQSGIKVYNLGIVPTPVVFKEARKYGSGIVITSSHNPIEWNGLKFILNGKGINEKELEIISNNQDISNSSIGNETSSFVVTVLSDETGGSLIGLTVKGTVALLLLVPSFTL